MCHTRVSVIYYLTRVIRLLTYCTPGPLSSLRTRVSRAEIYGSGHCMGWRFLSFSFYFFVWRLRAFNNVPHLLFQSPNPNLFIKYFNRMSVLVLLQISTVVFDAWNLSMFKARLVPWLDPPRSLNPFPFRNTIGFCSRKTKIKHQYKFSILELLNIFLWRSRV